MFLPIHELTPQRTKEQLGSHSGGNSMPPSQWDALYCCAPPCGPRDSLTVAGAA